MIETIITFSEEADIDSLGTVLSRLEGFKFTVYSSYGMHVGEILGVDYSLGSPELDLLLENGEEYSLALEDLDRVEYV